MKKLLLLIIIISMLFIGCEKSSITLSDFLVGGTWYEDDVPTYTFYSYEHKLLASKVKIKTDSLLASWYIADKNTLVIYFNKFPYDKDVYLLRAQVSWDRNDWDKILIFPNREPRVFWHPSKLIRKDNP